MRSPRVLRTHRHSALVFIGGLAVIVLAAVALIVQIGDLQPRENARRLDLSNQLDQVVTAHVSGSLLGVSGILDPLHERMLSDPGLWFAPHDYAFEKQLERAAEQPIARDVLVVDTRGHIVQGSSEGDFADRALIQSLGTGADVVFSGGRPGAGHGVAPYIGVIRSVVQDGELRGAVAVILDLSHFDEVYGTLPITIDGTAIFMLSEDGYVHAHWVDGAFSYGQMLAPRRQTITDFYQGPLASPIDGLDHLATARRIPGTPLFAVVSLPPLEFREALAAGFGTPGIVLTSCVLGMAFLLTWTGIAGIRQMQHARFLAETANRAKSEFLALMSHELRTPLNAIIGFSEMMENEVYGPLGDARYKDYMGDIRGSGERLLSVINTILDLSKIEAGKMELAEERVGIADAVAGSARMVCKSAQSAGIQLLTRVPRDLPYLIGDARLIEQVITNLVTNAIKYTDAHGIVSIEAHTTRQGGLVIAVRDTGIGMAPDDIAVALSPFGQVDHGHERRRPGTGLGLPLSKRIVEKHEGRLEIASERFTGTTVTVSFPPSRTAPKVRSARQQGPSARQLAAQVSGATGQTP